MVAVPVTPRNRVETQPLGNDRLRYTAPRNLVGPAIEDAGRAMSRAADDFDQIEAAYDQADVLNLDNTLAAEISTALSEFSNLRGDAPGRELSSRLETLDSRAEELAGAARSERAGNMLRRALSVRVRNASARMTEHADNQMFAFRDSALVAGRNQAVLDAISVSGTDQFGVAVGVGLQRLEERAALLGAPPEALAIERSKFLDEVHGGVIDRFFVVPDPDIDAVMGYLEQFGDQMTPALQNDTLARLQDPLQGRMARSDADMVMGFASPDPETGEARSVVASPVASANAADLLRGLEGFREGAYWDVNHHRVGFGSDTITTASGEVRTVRQGDRVSQADAERDLTRRVNAIEAGAARRAGRGWQQLPDGARAAVISVAYNYGEGHERLLPLWQAASRGDASEVASVIESFAGDNGGVNRQRRQQEAQTARGGGGTYANTPRQWDRARIYANLDAVATREGWNPERTERTRRELDQRIGRDEGLLKEQYADAADEAARIIAMLPDGLTSVSQLPGAVRSRMDPTDLAQLEADARRLREQRSGAEREAAQEQRAAELEYMKRFLPQEYAQVNPLREVTRLAPDQYNAFLMDWTEARQGKPPKQSEVDAGIRNEIAFQGRLADEELSEDEQVRLAIGMEAQLGVIREKKGFITAADFGDAYRSMRKSVGGGFFSRSREVYQALEVPPAEAERIRQAWTGSTPPTDAQILQTWMELRGGR